MKKTILATLALLLLVNTSFAGVLDINTKDKVGNAFESSFFGGMVLAGTFGAGAAGLALAESAMILGISLAVDSLSSSIQYEKNLLIVKEVINKEAINYQLNGEIGAVLGAGIKTLKNDNPELSDAEAIDNLTMIVNP
jgi:hypothetical protein